MLGNALLPLPLSPNGLTLISFQGLDLQTDLYCHSFSVWLVPFDYIMGSHLIVWDGWVLLPLGFICLCMCMVLHVEPFHVGLESSPCFGYLGNLGLHHFLCMLCPSGLICVMECPAMPLTCMSVQ